jgi:hypothetical protein
MNRLEDMRVIEYDWTCQYYVFEVNKNGQSTGLVRVDTAFHDKLQSARPHFAPLYSCECGEEFSSWEEAKDHISWDDE